MMFMGRQRKGQGSSPAFDPYQCAATCAAQQGFCPKPENPVKPLKSPFDLVSMLQLGDELGLGAMPHAAAPASRPLPALPSLSPQATTPFNVGVSADPLPHPSLHHLARTTMSPAILPPRRRSRSCT